MRTNLASLNRQALSTIGHVKDETVKHEEYVKPAQSLKPKIHLRDSSRS